MSTFHPTDDNNVDYVRHHSYPHTHTQAGTEKTDLA